jgi:hypothetical protein
MQLSPGDSRFIYCVSDFSTAVCYQFRSSEPQFLSLSCRNRLLFSFAHIFGFAPKQLLHIIVPSSGAAHLSVQACPLTENYILPCRQDFRPLN